MTTTAPRRKLIEVSIPLEAINKASAREKSIRHGHPSTLHLWWARRPLAACRTVLFAQLVDDPSSWPERFPTEQAVHEERRRLHRLIERLAPWEASNDELVLNEARWEIARSTAWGLGEEPPSRERPAEVLAYLQEKAPPAYDPFSGGGSIPLEAQRLGLRAYGSDLNPVAVLIGKALVEIPPKFAGLPPVNPARDLHKRWKGAQGLAEDLRHYGRWMREEAEKRIGGLYPKAVLPDGSEATVIAWLWARTVRSPDPAARGAMVPLVSSFMLSTKEKRKAWVETVIDAEAPEGWRFEVRTGDLTKAEEERLKKGTKTGHTGFSCLLSGAPIPFGYIRQYAQEFGLQSRLMAIVAEGDRKRIYLAPTSGDEEAAASATPEWGPEELVTTPSHDVDRLPMYGMRKWRDAFTPRQLVALTTFSDLVGATREKVLADALAVGSLEDPRPLHGGGLGAAAYADAVATYLGFITDRVIDRHTSIATWDSSPSKLQLRNTFARQAVPMTWDFGEGNVFANSSGAFLPSIEWVALCLEALPASGSGKLANIDATKNSFPVRPVVISTDPPYYDNIGYADLSDFFYVWLKRSLSSIWPDLFRRLITPKEGELVATPYRHGGKKQAEDFFMEGMGQALAAMRKAAVDDAPLTIYYAFKQAEAAAEGVTSAGWASFLQAVVESGLIVEGTWPMRTELANRMIGKDANALASSIVLVCRKRPEAAPTISRADFLRALRREMPAAIEAIRAAGVGPVDMQQSVIGPGMGVFSRNARVLEDDDKPMDVKTALALINRVWEEIEQDLSAVFDAPTQVALAWYAAYRFEPRPSGEAIVLAQAKDAALDTLFASGVFEDLRGRAALTARERLPRDWTPAKDRNPTIWECVQHVARVLNAEDGGAAAAALLVARMGEAGEHARALAYRLFEIATHKGWADEALVYNELAQEWSNLQDRADELGAQAAPRQGALDL